MTTIAYKDGVIAYDSRSSAENSIIDDDFNKCVIRNGVKYFFTGSVSDFEFYIKAYESKEVEKGLEGAWFAVEGVDIYRCGVNDQDGFWKTLIDKAKHYVIGSGGDHAITAMDLGLSAKEAVKMAAKRGSATGGKIRVCKV